MFLSDCLLFLGAKPKKDQNERKEEKKTLQPFPCSPFPCTEFYRVSHRPNPFVEIVRPWFIEIKKKTFGFFFPRPPTWIAWVCLVLLLFFFFKRSFSLFFLLKFKNQNHNGVPIQWQRHQCFGRLLFEKFRWLWRVSWNGQDQRPKNGRIIKIKDEIKKIIDVVLPRTSSSLRRERFYVSDAIRRHDDTSLKRIHQQTKKKRNQKETRTKKKTTTTTSGPPATNQRARRHTGHQSEERIHTIQWTRSSFNQIGWL